MDKIDIVKAATKEPFGYFGKDEAPLAFVRAYQQAMIDDGWSIKPTYNTEPVKRAATLERDGFICLMLTRDNRDKAGHRGSALEVNISIWGPDGLHITVPAEYSFDEIRGATRKCTSCGKEDVDTFRYSFAGRACATCLPAAKKATEYPGWTK